MLRETKHTICKPLTILFNKSLAENIYSSDWQLAHLMPLFIKGDQQLPSNYRPVTCISCVGKVMERIIHKHIYNYLIQNYIILKNQSISIRQYGIKGNV